MYSSALFNPSHWYPQIDETPFEYWASFYPTAYLFGVKWRFADEFPLVAEAGSQVEQVAKKAVTAQTEAAKDMASFIKQNAVVKPVKKTAAAKSASASKPDVKDDAPTDVAAEVATEAQQAAVSAINKPDSLLATKPASVDDLTQIKGVGPKLSESLNEMGVYTLQQIAGLSTADLQWVDDNLTAFKGRAIRDDWVDQAKKLLQR